MGDLALTNMGLGDKAAALALSERAMTVIPVEKDVRRWSVPIEILARVAAQLGGPTAPCRVTGNYSRYVCRATGFEPAAYSCATPARFQCRSAPERSALRKLILELP